MVLCPQVDGYQATFNYEEGVSFSTENGGYRVNCWYQTLNVDEGGSHLESELILDAYWATEPGDPYVEVWHPPGSEGAAITYCSDVDEFRAGLGVTASTDVSVRVTYKFRQAHLPHDAEVGRAAANALRDVVAQYARSCDGVEIIPRSSYVTPLPPYLADAIDALGEVAPAPPYPPRFRRPKLRWQRRPRRHLQMWPPPTRLLRPRLRAPPGCELSAGCFSACLWRASPGH